MSGLFIAPFLLKRMSAFGFTTFADLFLVGGFSLWAASAEPNTLLMWLGVSVSSPGFNGNSTHAVKALASDLGSIEALLQQAAHTTTCVARACVAERRACLAAGRRCGAVARAVIARVDACDCARR